MLSPDTLEKLAEYAGKSEGGIVEVGSYVGGSTVALAIGNAGARPHAAIEIGGQYLSHPTLPSSDIIGDWRRNLREANLDERVSMFEGWSYQATVRNAVIDFVGEIGLLFADADGLLDPLLAKFGNYMTDECLLVFDDYISPGAPEKEARVRECVDRNLSQGLIVEDACISGTWFGRISDRSAKRILSSYPAFIRERGTAFLALFESDTPFDSGCCGSRSQLRLFEDGIELGPAHSPHDEIRKSGEGRFSHWSYCGSDLSALYFSSSDGSNPNSNGRLYEVAAGGSRRDIRTL